jgi:SAM-dependent methyltransferase
MVNQSRPADALPAQLVCPVCRTALPVLNAAAAIFCQSCGAEFSRGRYVFDLTPPLRFRTRSPLWEAWDQIQENGLSGYVADPERNLSIGQREDCDAFRRFSSCHGLVLDVGCGPQAWPAYFDRSPAVRYVGIDPLADLHPSEFLKFAGLGEFLPFASGAFDHVLFATTLDHFVDPQVALAEAARVLKNTGEIDVWMGEKDPAAPKPARSPEWFERLKQPELADDLFHIKRMHDTDVQVLVDRAGLMIVDRERHQIDPYRANCFYRLRVAR